MSADATSSKPTALASWAALAALLGFVALLIGPSLASVAHQPQADEGYYLLYARAVAERGWSAFPGLFREWIANQHNWIFPPPSRVAFVVTSAVWLEFAPASAAVQQQLVHVSTLSLAAHLATSLIVFAFVRRHRGELQALLVAALIAFSPLYLGLSRLALTDSFITLWQVASLALFFEAVRAPSRWLWQALFAVAFMFAILAKEISVLLALPFAGLVLIERYHAKRALVLWRFAALLAVPVMASLLVWMAAAGGFDTLKRTLEIVMSSPATNEYAQRLGGGPWYRYVVDELLASPWPTALGLLAIPVVAWRWRKGEYDALLVFAVVTYVAQVAVLSFFTKNLRYVAVLELPLRLLAVALIFDVVRARRRVITSIAAVALVAVLCWRDWTSYRLIFVTKSTYDPMSVQLLWIRELVPPPMEARGG